MRNLKEETAYRESKTHERSGQALEQKLEQLTTLIEASQTMVASLERDHVLARIISLADKVVSTDHSGVVLIDEAGTPGRSTENLPGVPALEYRIRERGLTNWIVHSHQPVVVDEIHEDGTFTPELGPGAPHLANPFILKAGIKSLAGLPLITKDRLLGVLYLHSLQPCAFHDQLPVLTALANHAAIAIENSRLYEQARQDAETKSMLLREVNHRIKNNLSTIIGLLYATRRRTEVEDHPTYQFIIKDLINRLQGLSTVHSLLSASEWSPLLLSEVAAWVIRSSLQTLSPDHWVSVDVSPSPVRVTPDQAHDLALVINELTTNTVKHALKERGTAHITVDIDLDADMVTLTFRDDGPGYQEDVLRTEQGNIGLDLVQNLACKNLRGEFSHYNDSGAVTVISFKARVEPTDG